MKPSKIALSITAATVAAGAIGLVWLSSHPNALLGRSFISRRSAQQMLMDVPEPYRALSSKTEPSNRSDRGLVNASLEASQNAMIASQMLIRTGQMTLEVKAFDEAFGKLQRIASENGGYIANITANRQDQGRASGTVVVRVQPTRYFQALDALRAIGKVEQEGVSTQDVTKEFADLEARLTNKRQLEARMREILRTRSAKMEDLLEAEQQLSQVTEQVERMEGERRYFQQMISLSTITVDLHEPAKILASSKPGLFAPVAAAAQNSIELLVQFLALLVSALVFLAPWVVLGGGTWMAIRRVAVRRKAEQEG